ncbi:unnamed protein product [Pleuronectes platessa]|uniref:Uncharacterized protein n=1 Tax=Pleuronectes platessa TaxID=8262 RepID=A0A9N7V2S7_PLEPL|nr:unnamed protein product [Pleuronectes platessa]
MAEVTREGENLRQLSFQAPCRQGEAVFGNIHLTGQQNISRLTCFDAGQSAITTDKLNGFGRSGSGGIDAICCKSGNMAGKSHEQNCKGPRQAVGFRDQGSIGGSTKKCEFNRWDGSPHRLQMSARNHIASTPTVPAMDTAPRSKRKKAPAPATPRRHRIRTSRCRTLSLWQEGDGATAPPAAARAQRFYNKYEHRPMISLEKSELHQELSEVSIEGVPRRRGRSYLFVSVKMDKHT